MLPAAQHVGPVQPWPPHCPYLVAQAAAAVVVVAGLVVVVVGLVVVVGMIAVVVLVVVVGLAVVVTCVQGQLHRHRYRVEQSERLAFVGDDPAAPQPMRAVSIAMSSYHHVSVLPE